MLRKLPKELAIVDGGHDLYITVLVIGQTQNVVSRNMIKVSQANKNIGGNVSLSQFVITVNLL